MKSLEEYFKIASSAVDLANEFLVKNFGESKTMFHKSDMHYSAKDDKLCNDIYINFLKKQTPEVGLFTEEGEQSFSSKLVWVVDPIDGTTNYASGIPLFNTQISLIENNEPLLSIVSLPILGQKYTAIKGKGAKCDDKKIEVSKVKSLDKAVLCLSKGKHRKDFEWLSICLPKLVTQIRSLRFFSTTGLELAYIAAGKLDVFLSSGGSVYDYLPGVLIIKEAGGLVLNLKGEEWTIKDNDLIAANETLAKQILETLRRANGY